MSKGQKLWNRAKQIIPGGNQLLSKRAEMFLPDQWPAYYKKAKGVQVWDLDDRRYLDMSIMGMGTCILGYANLVVDRAVTKAIKAGSMSTLNCPEEVELAERLIALHPWSGMARFTRSGGEACSVAVRIGRAASRKDKVAFCGYHGWSDWYLSSNLADPANLNQQLLSGLQPLGVPQALSGTAFPFSYGHLEELRKIVAENPNEIGVIIMEVQRYKPIDLAFLKGVQQIAKDIGAVLIFDEVTSGFRVRVGGMHVLHNLTPDVVVLGKAMGNGYPIAAIVGRKEIMQAAQETFISSTFWTERVGFTAALAVIEQFEKLSVSKQLVKTGQHLKKGLSKIIATHRLDIEMVGMDPVPIMMSKEKDALLIKSVYTQEMLKKGFLAANLTYVSYAHTEKIVDLYLKATDEAFGKIVNARKQGNLEKLLKWPVCHSGFQRLN